MKMIMNPSQIQIQNNLVNMENIVSQLSSPSPNNDLNRLMLSERTVETLTRSLKKQQKQVVVTG